ncbi:MAG: hypothetical protein ACXVXC_04715 [Nocardioidaceae bacterium]
MTGRGRVLATMAVGAAAYTAVQWLGRTYGSTAAERRAPLPGDDVVSHPQTVVTHAVTIDAPPDRVWPWLVQMGWHRAGWYTARWVDRLLFPANDPSADTIVDGLQQLQVGDFIPDGPPETRCGFTVLSLVPGRHLLLHSTSHLPLSWRVRDWARVEWTWVFVVQARDDGRRTRLVFRWRCRAEPWWLDVDCRALVVPADLVMSRSMLEGLRRRSSAPAAA